MQQLSISFNACQLALFSMTPITNSRQKFQIFILYSRWNLNDVLINWYCIINGKRKHWAAATRTCTSATLSAVCPFEPLAHSKLTIKTKLIFFLSDIIKMSTRRKKRRHLLIRPLRNGYDDPYKRYLESTSQHRERFTQLMEQIDGSNSSRELKTMDEATTTSMIEVNIG